MADKNEVLLTLEEQNTFLDKILRYQEINALENIRCLKADDMDCYVAHFVDSNQKKISFGCGFFWEKVPYKVRFGLRIFIIWDDCSTRIDTENGPLYDKIGKLVGFMKQYCDRRIMNEKSILSG